MATEQGREFNPETASDLRPRKFEFVVFGEKFTYTLQIPEYILHRLDSTVMDKIYEHMHCYGAEVVTNAMRGGYVHTESGRKRMTEDIGLHLKNYIWERFSISQEKAGNECWQVAPSLQKVHEV